MWPNGVFLAQFFWGAAGEPNPTKNVKIQIERALHSAPPPPKISNHHSKNQLTFGCQLKVGLYGSTPLEGLNHQSLDMMALG